MIFMAIFQLLLFMRRAGRAAGAKVDQGSSASRRKDTVGRPTPCADKMSQSRGREGARMHEMTVAHEMLTILEERAKAQRIARITRVRLKRPPAGR
jgi:hypothetical protein